MYIEEEDEDIDADDSWYEKSQRKLADDAVIEGIEAIIREVETVQVRTLVSSEGEWGEHQPLVDRMGKALLSDYPDVLADEIGTDPPVRGDKCEARIHLREGSTPKKMRLMQMNGGRREAMEKVTDDWLKPEKIERCD